jgi:hypothetical protein
MATEPVTPCEQPTAPEMARPSQAPPARSSVPDSLVPRYSRPST